jgi:hypothetical protein
MYSRPAGDRPGWVRREELEPGDLVCFGGEEEKKSPQRTGLAVACRRVKR